MWRQNNFNYRSLTQQQLRVCSKPDFIQHRTTIAATECVPCAPNIHHNAFAAGLRLGELIALPQTRI